MLSVLLPITRAILQLNDPTFRGVLYRSVAWSIGSFAVLYVGAVWIVHRVVAFHGWLAWGTDIVGSIAASLLTLWLFLPVATAIGTMYLDRIGRSVERRFYPWLPPPDGASVLEQAWDGCLVALRVLALNIISLIMTLFLPGIGMILGWMIAAYAIGRGLFVAVAMRRMPRVAAESLYLENRSIVLVQGAILTMATCFPIVNLFIPIIGVATMVHTLDISLTRPENVAC